MDKPNPVAQNSSSLTTSGRPTRLTESQQHELIEVLTATATILGETVSSPRIMGVLAMVDHLPFERLRLVLSRWGQTHDWFPKPRQVIDAVNAKENDDFKAEEAWHRVLFACRGYSPDEGKFPDGVQLSRADWFGIQSVGGIRRLASTDMEKSDLGFIRRDFVHAWKLFEDKESRIRLELSWHTKQLVAGER